MDIKDFQRLVASLSLSIIQPTKIDFERLGEIPASETDIQISWKMIYPKEVPFKIENNVLNLAPLFEVTLSCNDIPIYSHKSIFIVLMNIINKKEFDTLWKDEEVQKFFREKQVLKTLWPIVRQQVLDGLSRLALPPVSLPWLM